jgi:ParB family chromosome partitioning protein
MAQVVDRGLSVRQTEELVRLRRPAAHAKKHAPASSIDPEVADLQDRLREALATQVEVLRSRRGGRILIRYYDEDDFLEIIAVLLRGRDGSAVRE